MEKFAKLVNNLVDGIDRRLDKIAWYFLVGAVGWLVGISMEAHAYGHFF